MWLRNLLLVTAIFCAPLVPRAQSQTAEFDQHLRDEYQGKIFVLRGFYSADSLLYSAKGALVGREISGDWTADGFVIVDDIHGAGPRLEIRTRRQLIISNGKFEFRAAEQPTADKKHVQPVPLEITIDYGQDVPTVEQAEAVISKIFLTPEDALSGLVPDYWKSCVTLGLIGRDDKCLFSQDILKVPGVSASGIDYAPLTTASDASHLASASPIVKVGNGVSPPRATYMPDPEFSDRARQSKFQGVVMLGLIVDRDGIPKNVRVLSPLGAGLDEKAVHAVQTWKFEPGNKDGEPVAVEIAIEVEFHLY